MLARRENATIDVTEARVCRRELASIMATIPGSSTREQERLGQVVRLWANDVLRQHGMAVRSVDPAGYVVRDMCDVVDDTRADGCFLQEDDVVVMSHRAHELATEFMLATVDGREVTTMQARAMRLLLHESIHGTGPMWDHRSFAHHTVEEACTELVARWVTREEFAGVSLANHAGGIAALMDRGDGCRPLTTYQGYIDAIAGAVRGGHAELEAKAVRLKSLRGLMGMVAPRVGVPLTAVLPGTDPHV